MSAWTPERRAAQAARVRDRKPWLNSTGPRTPEGKQRASRNARKIHAEPAVVAVETVPAGDPKAAEAAGVRLLWALQGK